MRRRTTRRTTVAVALAATGAVLLVGCGPENDGSGAGAAVPPASPTAAAPGTTAPATPAASASAAASAPTAAPGSGSPTAAVARCGAGDVTVSSAQQAKVRPDGTGTGAAVVGVTNTSGHACTLEGFPTVAGAGNGSPDRNVPLAVTRTGTAAPVRLAPGGRAWTKLTFVQVQGEADGYCASGATPAVHPTLVIGLPQAGSHQVGLDDGQFAECDNKVTVTPLTATRPS